MQDMELIRSNAELYNPRALKSSATRPRNDAAHHAHAMMDAIHSHVYKLKGQIGHIFRRCDKIMSDRLIDGNCGNGKLTHAMASSIVPTSTTRAEVQSPSSSSAATAGNADDMQVEEDKGDEEEDHEANGGEEKDATKNEGALREV